MSIRTIRRGPFDAASQLGCLLGRRMPSLTRLAAFAWILAASSLLAAAPDLARLAVSDNQRFLVTTDGQPFFWLADTGWELFHRLDLPEAKQYLDDRAAKRFNVIQAVAIAELEGLTVPNRQGHLPLIDHDPTRPAIRPASDDDYWDHMERIIAAAADRGLYIALLPTWGRYVSSKPFDGKTDGIFNQQNADSYGRFIGSRFANHTNIIWIIGGDRAPATPEAVAIWRALAEGIQAGVTAGGGPVDVLMTYHTAGPGHTSDYIHSEPWLDFTSAQSSHGDFVESWKFVEQHWQTEPIKPMIDLESSYPDLLIPAAWLPLEMRAAHRSTAPSSDHDARRAAYWAVFAGACGHTYGHHSIWQMHSAAHTGVLEPRLSWQEALRAPSAAQMGYLRGLIESFPMLERIPDQSLLVDPGQGRSHRRATRGEDYALVYCPDGGSFDLRLGVLPSERLTARWFNPRSNELAEKEPIENRGQRAFAPPASPAEGGDWVLILQTER